MKNKIILLGLTGISPLLLSAIPLVQHSNKQFNKNGNELYAVSNPGSILTFRRDAIIISNKSNNFAKYFYSNLKNNGQTRWYCHNLDLNYSTWDWTWANDTSSNHIEFMIYLNSNKFLYATIVFNYNIDLESHSDSNHIQFKFNESLFWTISDSPNNPNWNDKIWNYISADNGIWNDWNLHTNLTILNTTDFKVDINWNNHDIIV